MEKKIHYCWFGGNKLPKDVKKCIETWKKYLPDYEIKEWNESNFDINTCNFIKEAYENKKWAFVSDYVRIYALYKEGGIYFDTDLKVLKDISFLEDKDMFLGYEDSGFVGTAVIGVKEKNNKYIKEILDYYDKIEHFNPDIMYNYANPVIITKILKKYDSYVNEEGIRIIDDNVYIYPRDYFFPLSYNYAEREYTKNTCMVHLFNATWTSKGERRTVNIYRTFGPDLGKILNNSIDNIFGLKYKIVGAIKKIINNAKMMYSIHINRAKRVKEIKDKLKEIKDDFVIVCNPEYNYDNKTIECLIKDSIIYLREQYTAKEAKMMAEQLVETGKKLVVFNSYSYGWNQIIQEIKNLNRKIKIKAIVHSGNACLADNFVFENFNEIINLYDKGKIEEIGLFNKEAYEFYKEKGFNVSLLNEFIDIQEKEKYCDNKEKKEYLRIGIYPKNNDIYQNIFNQMGAVSLIEDAKFDCSLCNYPITTLARKYNINFVGNSDNPSKEELYKRMADNDVNLNISFIDDSSLVPLESFELGTPCIIGKSCKYFINTEFEKDIMVENENNILEIKEKILFVCENKDKILEKYREWREEYIKNAQSKFNKFLS